MWCTRRLRFETGDDDWRREMRDARCETMIPRAGTGRAARRRAEGAGGVERGLQEARGDGRRHLRGGGAHALRGVA